MTDLHLTDVGHGPTVLCLHGIGGSARDFADVIYATHARDVGKPGPPTALDKLDRTPEPHVLVYDASRLERVRGREWAFTSKDRRTALVAVFRVLGD